MELTRESCGEFAVAQQREWLVTNGIGGYAAGSVGDLPTRRYHGLLVAALSPPLGRRVLFARLDVRVTYAGQTYDLSTTRWHDGTLAPTGYANIERFESDGRAAIWTYHIADAVVERRVWMEREQNAVYVSLTLRSGSQSAAFTADVFAVDRDFHAVTNTYAVDNVTTIDGPRARIRLGDGTPWHVSVSGATLAPAAEWYYGISLLRETERGLEDREDQYHALNASGELAVGDEFVLLAATDAELRLDARASRERVEAHAAMLINRWRARNATGTGGTPDWLPQLVLAADQFIVARATETDPGGKTVMAGYPWFEDWGRDTMIALPGLTLVTGRPEIAAAILRTFARYVDAGMLPNRFPDAGGEPAYNTVDAALLFVVAIDAYVRETHDHAFVREIFGVVASIVDWYVRGTRFGIGVDPADGLLRSGESGVQLTWMDAKVGDWVVTPRTGKAVEINALWYNALRMTAAFARLTGDDPDIYDTLAARVLASFGRFWNDERNYPFDVIDGPDGNQPHIRPNALFAVSLPHRLLDRSREVAIVLRAAHDLLTAHGLRSLAPGEPGYVPIYHGGPRERDAAYHQGTVWPWLMGTFLEAHLRVFGDRAAVDTMLEPFGALLRGGALGTLPEITDASAPFRPRGCFAQAWSVAEILRVATPATGS